MAYTIISQNNNTTTLTDGINTITVPSRVNLTSGNFTIVEVNNNMATLQDGDGNVYRDVPCVATLVDAGGGSSVDYSKTVQKTTTMPTADSSNAGDVYMYTGATDANYTTNYIYENITTTTPSSASATQTVGSGLSDISVDVDTLESFTGWTTDNSLQIFYTADGWSVDTTSLGVTYTGTPSVGDAITITYTAEVNTYAWTRVDVQPAPEALPDQTGQSGKFLTTDGTAASWSDKPLVNTATGTNALTIAGTATTWQNGTNVGVASQASAIAATALGRNANAGGVGSIAIGNSSKASAKGAIILNTSGASKSNSDADTFKVANSNGNFEIMDANGNLPADRLASTTGLADGNYRLRLTMASGVPTLSWVAE